MFYVMVERFGYMLLSVGKTKKETLDSILTEYNKTYVEINNCYPSKEEIEMLKEEAIPQSIKYGEVVWL